MSAGDRSSGAGAVDALVGAADSADAQAPQEHALPARRSQVPEPWAAVLQLARRRPRCPAASGVRHSGRHALTQWMLPSCPAQMAAALHTAGRRRSHRRFVPRSLLLPVLSLRPPPPAPRPLLNTCRLELHPPPSPPPAPSPLPLRPCHTSAGMRLAHRHDWLVPLRGCMSSSSSCSAFVHRPPGPTSGTPHHQPHHTLCCCWAATCCTPAAPACATRRFHRSCPAKLTPLLRATSLLFSLPPSDRRPGCDLAGRGRKRPAARQRHPLASPD